MIGKDNDGGIAGDDNKERKDADDGGADERQQ